MKTDVGNNIDDSASDKIAEADGLSKFISAFSSFPGF
jgi:hypothetical protein